MRRWGSRLDQHLQGGAYLRVTQMELTDRLVSITNALPDLPEGSAERHIALINLRNIRSVLARHDLTPWLRRSGYETDGQLHKHLTLHDNMPCIGAYARSCAKNDYFDIFKVL